ncbi:MAG: hypothetical protein C0614_01245 [Desulfuromonas sp.]|nr:MAG: hypothetical protein C0614_01245 [Desulfuromonas sp.]
MNRLCTLLTLALLTTHSLAQPDPSTVESRARKLINAQGCKACHSLQGAGARLAPKLENVVQRLTADQIRLSLTNPLKTHTDGSIPDFSHLSTDEVTDLVQFLSSFNQP